MTEMNDGDFVPPSLEDLLKREPDAAAQIEAPAAKPEEPPAPPPPADTAAVEPPKGDTAAPPAAQEQTTVPLSALEKVRKEAQDAKAKVAELEARLGGQNKPAPTQPQATLPDPMLDPEGYRAMVAWETKVAASTAIVQSQHADFDEVMKAYMAAAAAREAPMIPMDHPNPAKFAYDHGKRVMKFAEFGDLDTLETRLRAKWEAEAAEKAAAAKAEAEAKKTAAIMPTTAGDRDAKPKGESEGWEPPSLETILNRKRKAAS